MSAAARTADPIGATMLFSLLLHGVLILGIAFHFAKPAPSLPTLDVTLVNVANREAPDKADFLAQANNRGGGQSDRAERPSQPFSGALPKPDPGMAAQTVAAATPPPREATPERMVTTSGASRYSVASDTARPAVPPQDAATASESRRQQEMAQLAAELRDQTQAYAKRPRKKYISANTREYLYATYMREWSDRVQRVGNLNYPDAARQLGLHGDLLLTVGISRDGSIHSIDVVRSSGQPLLDAAAERIVQLAAPFPPLPAEAKVDQLYITRTWEFLPGGVLRSK